MKNKVDVCIYITTRNRAKMLERAVKSVLSQSVDVNEIIIVDDASTDNTESYCSQLIKNFENIKYFRNESNLGAPASRNLAIRESQSKYITGLDDDDEFKENRVEKLYSFYTQNNYSFVCDALSINNSKQIDSYIGEIDFNKILYFNIVGSQVFTLRENLINIGGFDTSYPAWQDYETWTRLIKKYGPSYKIKGNSYIVHTEHDNRITTNNNQKNAFLLYLKNNIDSIKISQLISLYITYIANSGKKGNLTDGFFLLCIGQFRRFISYTKKFFI